MKFLRQLTPYEALNAIETYKKETISFLNFRIVPNSSTFSF